MARFQTPRTFFRTSSRYVLWSLLSFHNLILVCQERKYFDSGDYALSKAGKASDVGVTSIGSQHPLPENIPHLSSPSPANNGSAGSNGNGVPQGGQGGSPVKESSFLHRETSVNEQEGQENAMSPGEEAKDVPVRWQG